MEEANADPPANPASNPGGPSTAGSGGSDSPDGAHGGVKKDLAVAMLLSSAAALAIGGLAFLISRAGIAPAVLFPLAVGCAVGLAERAIFDRWRLPLCWRKAALIGLILGVLAVAAEDVAGYRSYLQSYAGVQGQSQLAAGLAGTIADLQPVGFRSYLSHVIARGPFWWWFDALATPLAAAGTAVWSRRRKDISGATPIAGPPLSL